MIFLYAIIATTAVIRITDIVSIMGSFLFLGNIGAGEILIIALVVLLFFGGRKIPELMKGLGKGVKSFKDGMNEVEKDLSADSNESKESDRK